MYLYTEKSSDSTAVARADTYFLSTRLTVAFLMYGTMNNIKTCSDEPYTSQVDNILRKHGCELRSRRLKSNIDYSAYRHHNVKHDIVVRNLQNTYSITQLYCK